MYRCVNLIEDPLETRDVAYLEKILNAAKGFSYLDAVHEPPMYRSVGIPDNTKRDQVNVKLPGGDILRFQYAIADIRAHYDAVCIRS